MPRSPRALAALLVLSAALSACSSEGGSGGGIGVATGLNVLRHAAGDREPAPAIAGELLTGGRLDPVAYRGDVVVVNFWGSWCGPCRKEQPLLQALSEEYAERGVSFLGVNTRRDQRAAALAFLEEFSVTYPSLYDPASRVAADFRVRVMPATYVVDREGRIAATIVGALRAEDDLRTVLDEELSR